MADAITIEFKGFEEIKKRFSSMEKRMIEDIDGMLNASAEDIATEAKKNAPIDEGLLARSISTDNSKLLEKHIVVNAFYAAFVEFGTGKHAAEYVASLPQDWQTFAAQFKGSGNGKGTFKEFIQAMEEYLIRHGAPKNDIKQHAYNVARKILINGVTPHPFIYPAFRDAIPKIEKNITTILNEL